MKNDKIDQLFEELDFDTAEPASGHKERFLKKLEKARAQKLSRRQPKIRSLWGPIIGIAASIAVALMLFGNIFIMAPASNGELASVSPEMKETQDFYSSVIERELNTIEEEKTPETEAIVNDALEQMEKLEKEYTHLKKDLLNSGNDKRVIYAMINNFQQRIDLLNNVLTQIENIKSLKSQSHESTII